MKLFQCSIFSWSLCHFYEIIRLLLCFYSDLYFPPNNSGKNIRSALGFFIAGIPFVKNPGLSFLHFRLRWCSFTWKRSCFAILGEISWERSTYRLKFEHEHLGKCFRNSLIRQCHNYVDKVKSVKKNMGVSQPRWAIWREIWKLRRLLSLLYCLYFPVINYIFIFVNKTSTNFAILSELGRIPFALDCFTSVFKYWYV